MPELPEVETVRQTLRRRVMNKTIIGVDILYDKIIKTDLDFFKSNIINQKINEIERIGKYLLIKLDHFYLISHLRMEGKYLLRQIGEERSKHDHIVFKFNDQTELRYNDVRKFGTMHLKTFDNVYLGEPLEKMGLEPFDEQFTLDYLMKKIKGKRPIKNVLLDQTIISGLGNIYVDEVLFRARLHPERLSDTLEEQDLINIKEASIQVLNKAVKLGGTTIRSYYSDDNITGLFQNELLVHSKKGECCPNCRETIIKIKVGGRGTYYCPKCQIR